jgi:hypothetical protein
MNIRKRRSDRSGRLSAPARCLSLHLRMKALRRASRAPGGSPLAGQRTH